MNLNVFGKVIEELIEELEEFLGFLFLEDYKKFLSEYNGGILKVRYSKFFVKELNQEIFLDVLYGIGVKKIFDLSECYEEFEEDMLLISLIIGDDLSLGLIVFIIDIENYGVYYWDYFFYFLQFSEEENMYKIVDSFKDFINGLKNF